ncbi:hypothetical protein L7F22_048371 [Adiantum nelumboides]|nr:hypothetical protein [Adiantum nelumboides]
MDAKSKHRITSLVPIIIVEDETTIKRRIRWNAKDNTLIGFCGIKGEQHQCSSKNTIIVGEESQGYDKIVDAFQNHVVGSYARLFIELARIWYPQLPTIVLEVKLFCYLFDYVMQPKYKSDCIELHITKSLLSQCIKHIFLLLMWMLDYFGSLKQHELWSWKTVYAWVAMFTLSLVQHVC